MIKYLSDDDPALWEKVKDHTIDMPDDWEGNPDLFCKKCGKKAILSRQMLWICPEWFDIDPQYLHPG